MPIQGVVFDLGHTLMHLTSTWPEIFERGSDDLMAYLAHRAPDLDGQLFARTWLDRRREGFARARRTMREVTAEASMRWTFAQFGQLNPSSELVRGAIDAFFAYEDTCWCAIPDAQAVLRTLAKRELRMGMLSNASHDPLIQRLVDRLGFRPWLDPALSSADTGIRKPDPAAFGPILQAWKLPGRALMMVGDTLGEDILGARRAGMHAVWIPSRKDARQESAVQASDPLPETPDATIDRLGDLPDYLDRL